ncbi:hypothetical protein KR009_004500, partial [Drosophila setifemur]
QNFCMASKEPESSWPKSKPLSLKEEFRWQRFGLHHDAPLDFVRSEWQSKPKSSWFLAYRWLLASFLGTGVVSHFIKYFQGGYWFLYLTNYGFLMCGITTLTGAILVTLYHCKAENWVPSSGLIKFYWACYWTTLSVSFVISITYWGMIYPSDRVLTNLARVSDLYNIWIHAVPPIVLSIDHFLVAQPARLLHFVYPVGFGLIYGGFTIIYYALGGHDLNGRRYLYKFLNYGKPLRVIGTYIKLSVLVTIVSTLNYGLYRLRKFIA